MLLALCAGAAPAAAADMQPVSLYQGLRFPAGIAFAADGTMFFTEREGRVRVAVDGRLDPDPVASVETTTAGESGLLGVAVSPDDRWVYVFASDASGSSNRVLRIPRSGGDVETVLSGLPGGVYHNGGGLAFDRAGHLFVSNGEIHDGGRAQDPEAMGGKIYRVTPLGDPVADNPFGAGSMVYALGLRNPFGLTIDPVGGDPFVTENGPSSNDEINRIVRSGNYGWPTVLGRRGNAPGVEATMPGRYVDPVLDYTEIIVPTGIAFADPKSSRRAFAGDLFFGAFAERTIHRVRLDDARRTVTSDHIFLQEQDPVIAVAWGPEGLYYSTPSAIKLLPLAKEARPAVPPPAGESGLRLGRILVVVVSLGLIGAGVVIAGKKRGRA